MLGKLGADKPANYLPVLKVCKMCNVSQAWNLDLKDTDLLSLFTLNCEDLVMEKHKRKQLG